MRKRAIVVLLLGPLTALAACTSGGSTASTTPSTVVTTTTRVTAAETAVTQSFKADLTIQKAGLGLLALTNTGKQPATIQGWPTLTFLNAANEMLAVPLRKVNIPGAGPSITVKPGETAFAGVKWATGDKASAATFVATSLELTPPGGTKPLNVNIIDANGKTGTYVEFDITSAQVGTLQPSTQGVLVF